MRELGHDAYLLYPRILTSGSSQACIKYHLSTSSSIRPRCPPGPPCAHCEFASEAFRGRRKRSVRIGLILDCGFEVDCYCILDTADVPLSSSSSSSECTPPARNRPPLEENQGKHLREAAARRQSLRALDLSGIALKHERPGRRRGNGANTYGYGPYERRISDVEGFRASRRA